MDFTRSLSSKAMNPVTHKTSYNSNNDVQSGGLVILNTNEKSSIRITEEPQ